MKKQPLYLKIIIRLAFLILPIVALYFLMVFNYNPHENDVDGEHHHSMGPMFGFVIFSGFITAVWFLAIMIELIWKRFKTNKKVAFWLIFLVVLSSLTILLFI